MHIGVDLVQLHNGEYRTGKVILANGKLPVHRNGGQDVPECKCGTCPTPDPINSNIQLFFADEHSLEQHLKRAHLRVPNVNILDIVNDMLKQGAL